MEVGGGKKEQKRISSRLSRVNINSDVYVKVDLAVRGDLRAERHRRFHEVLDGLDGVAGRLEQRHDTGRVRSEQEYRGQKQYENRDPYGRRVQIHGVRCERKNPSMSDETNENEGPRKRIDFRQRALVDGRRYLVGK